MKGIVQFGSRKPGRQHSVSSLSPCAAPSPGFVVTGRGPNHRVWTQVNWTTNSSGRAVARTNSFTELATGISALRGGVWQDTTEGLAVLPDGSAAVSTNLAHSVSFPADLCHGAILVTTPEGVRLRTRPTAIAYESGTNSVLLAEIKEDCTGELLPDGNSVIWRGAFDGLRADIRATATRAGVQCDLILRETPPAPGDAGLAPSPDCVLQLLTECLEGEVLRATGPMAKANPFRFSTKYHDDETDLLYYGYRYYNAGAGRWLSRDPLKEAAFAVRGGTRESPPSAVSGDDESAESLINDRPKEASEYAFVGNRPLAAVDSLGLLKFEGCTPTETNELSQQFSAYCEKVKESKFKCCLGHFNIPKRLAGECGDPDVKIKCVHSYTKMCDPGTCSWSYPGSRTIRMCPDGLAKTGMCNDPYGCQIMHEMTHMIGHPFEHWPQQVGRCLGCTYWK